jgi:NodT family efflux transporter outer membrane factor (OMF) lipoprotein
MSVRSFVRRGALALAAGALAACSSMAPRYERPAAPVAAAFPLAPAAAASAPDAAAPAARWRDFLGGDPRLVALVDLALANNRDLRVAVANIEVARNQARVTGAAELPTVALAATHTRTTGQPTVDTFGLGVSAWELDLWGRVRSLTDAALAQYAATRQARAAAQVSLVASVAGAYVAMAADQALADLAQRTFETRTETMKLVQLRFDQGVASSIELQDNRTLVEAARVALAQARRQRALDEDALVLLVGRPLPADLPPAPAWDAIALPDVPVGLPSQVLLQRPDVVQAEDQLRAANADIGAARAAFFPTISLTGSAGTASTSLDHLFEHAAFSFVPQVTLPIFDAGRNGANLRISQAQRDIAVAQYEKAVQSAFRDVADALAGRATLAEQLDAQQAQADAEAKRFALSSLLYENGVASSLDLLDAQRALFAARQALVQTRLLLLQNRIAVYRAIGGGWSQEDAREAASR